MGEQRGGEGTITSSVAAKQTLGRSFQRVAKDHVGQRADPTHYAAERSNFQNKRAPTPLEMKLLFEENSDSVRVYRAAQMSDQQIYKILNKQSG